MAPLPSETLWGSMPLACLSTAFSPLLFDHVSRQNFLNRQVLFFLYLTIPSSMFSLSSHIFFTTNTKEKPGSTCNSLLQNLLGCLETGGCFKNSQSPGCFSQWERWHLGCPYPKSESLVLSRGSASGPALS